MIFGRRPPPVFWLYLGATALSIGLSFAPSSVHTGYTWSGAVIWSALLLGLFFQSTVSRWILVLINLLAAFGGLAVQSGTLDAMATAVSALNLLMAGLLLSSPMRQYTSNRPSLLRRKLNPS